MKVLNFLYFHHFDIKSHFKKKYEEIAQINVCFTTKVGGNYKRPKSKIAVWGIGVVLSG